MLSTIRKLEFLVWGMVIPSAILLSGSNANAGGSWGKCPSAECTDPKGCIELKPGEKLKIASFLPEVGEVALLSADAKRGFELGMNSLNADQNAIRGNKMKFLNHQVELVAYDSGCGDIDTDALRATAASIVDDPTTVFTMGTFCSGDAIRTLDIFTEAGHTLISPANTNPRLTDPVEFPPPSFYARAIYNDQLQGEVVANFANSNLGASLAVTIDDGGAYGIGLASAFRENFVGQSGIYSLTTQTPAEIAADLAANPPDFIFFAGNLSSDAIAVATAIRADTAFDNTALGFGDSQASNEFAGGGAAVEGVYVSSPDVTAVTDPDFYNMTFLPVYEMKYGEAPPTPYHIFAYDIPKLMSAAAEQVACTAMGGVDRIGRQALYDQLLATTDLTGLGGTYTCNSSGDCNPTAVIAVLQVQSGQFVKVYP